MSGEWRVASGETELTIRNEWLLRKFEDGPRNRCAPRWMKSTSHSSGLTLAAWRSSWGGVWTTAEGTDAIVLSYLLFAVL